jgi:AcrR family transcriptional regulator
MRVVENVRKAPRQQRARASVDCVLEAAAQVLEACGEDGFNTNAVAERAGVSIGTLYRYFSDKQSILQALALRETEAHRRA